MSLDVNFLSHFDIPLHSDTFLDNAVTSLQPVGGRSRCSLPLSITSRPPAGRLVSWFHGFMQEDVCVKLTGKTFPDCVHVKYRLNRFRSKSLKPE